MELYKVILKSQNEYYDIIFVVTNDQKKIYDRYSEKIMDVHPLGEVVVLK